MKIGICPFEAIMYNNEIYKINNKVIHHINRLKDKKEMKFQSKTINVKFFKVKTSELRSMHKKQGIGIRKHEYKIRIHHI